MDKKKEKKRKKKIHKSAAVVSAQLANPKNSSGRVVTVHDLVSLESSERAYDRRRSRLFSSSLWLDRIGESSLLSSSG